MPVRHGNARKGNESRSYVTWKHMRGRCLRKTHKDFKYYGGRGITICKRWMKFDNFLRDMGERPVGMTIERIRNNRGYMKSNCKWASRRDQVLNKRGNFVKGREGLRGAKAPWAKLTPAKVSKIRKLCGHVSQRAIGRKFHVSQSMVSMIHTGLSW